MCLGHGSSSKQQKSNSCINRVKFNRKVCAAGGKTRWKDSPVLEGSILETLACGNKIFSFS